MATNIDLENKIIELYQSGLSMAKVGEQVGKSAATVFRILKKYNITTRTHGGIDKLPDEEILKKYFEDRRTLEDIGKDYGVSINTIKKVILDNGKSIKTRMETMNPFLKEDYFENIDTEAKAYFLGFLITDGCVLEPDIQNRHPKHKICLELQTKDKYILESFQKELGLNNQLYYFERIRTLSPNLVKTNLLTCYSDKMAQDLSKYGVVPRKTFTAYLPQLRDDLMPHLIRGLIDGDGWLSISNGSLTVGFCGNEQCVTQVRDFLVKKLNVHNVKVYQKEEHCWGISWSSKKDTMKICQYIYNDAHFYLTRKFDKYKSIIENTEVT